RARKMAERAETVDDAWLLAYGRTPTSEERQAAEAFLQKRLAADAAPLAKKSEPLEDASQFKENTPHERLIAEMGEREGDEFTVEAVFEVNSIDVNATPRTIVSRWSGAKDSL